MKVFMDLQAAVLYVKNPILLYKDLDLQACHPSTSLAQLIFLYYAALVEIAISLVRFFSNLLKISEGAL